MSAAILGCLRGRNRQCAEETAKFEPQPASCWGLQFTHRSRLLPGSCEEWGPMDRSAWWDLGAVAYPTTERRGRVVTALADGSPRVCLAIAFRFSHFEDRRMAVSVGRDRKMASHRFRGISRIPHLLGASREVWSSRGVASVLSRQDGSRLARAPADGLNRCNKRTSHRL
jgi:hypothetical protein